MSDGQQKIANLRLFLSHWGRRLMIFFAVLGPGLITAFADNDAAGIATYTVAAALFGIASQILVIPTTLLLAITQDVGARIAIVTRKGLGDLIRERFGIRVTVALFIIYFIVNQAVVLQDISGLKASFQLFNFPWQAALIITALILSLLIVRFDYKRIQRIFFILIFFYFSYVVVALIARPNWIALVKETFYPRQIKFSLNFSFTLIAVLGTTVTAWGQFFISSYVNDKKLSTEHLRYEKLEVYIGAFITNFFSYMIAIAVAVTLFANNIVVRDAQTAALALKPLAGNLTFLLFAGGLFGASILGLTIVPLATAYVFSEFFGYEGSLDIDFEKGRLFYIFFLIQLLIGLIVALFPSINLFQITLYANYLNGAMLPVIFYFIIKFAETKEIMGNYVLSRFNSIFLRASAIVITIAVVISFIGGLLHIA